MSSDFTEKLSVANCLPREFYDRDTLEVAEDLLGCILVREYEGVKLVGRITEVEAYVGRVDKACHAYNYRRTARTETLFAKPGTAYVYLIYGMYNCLNFVTEAEGEPAAVLIRGLEVMEEIAGADVATEAKLMTKTEEAAELDMMAKLRFGRDYNSLTTYQRKNFLNGPGKLCRALAIDRELNGHDLTKPPLYVLPRDREVGKILRGPRIGIDYAEEAKDFPWRFRVE